MSFRLSARPRAKVLTRRTAGLLALAGLLGVTISPSFGQAEPGERSSSTSRVPVEVWHMGSGLSTGPELGPNSELYASSRDGALDVLEPNGKLRYEVGLGAAAIGRIFVDPAGNAFARTANGYVVGIGREGQRLFTYRAPSRLQAGLGFAEGIGLLFLGRDNAVYALNRVGTPTLRYPSRSHVESGPFGIWGRCVVTTQEGDVLAVSRYGVVRKVLAGTAGPGVELAGAPSGQLWLHSGSSLTSLEQDGRVRFTVGDVLAMATLDSPASGEARAVVGAVLLADGSVRWLDSDGHATAEARLGAYGSLTARRKKRLAVSWREAWLLGEGDVAIRVEPDGALEQLELPGMVGMPLFAKHRTLVGLSDGRILAFAAGT